MFQISELARKFGLSRSTLLYYDRIGLLTPSQRTEASYRLYSSKDVDRLATICTFRQAGLTIDDICTLLKEEGDANRGVLERRIREMAGEILNLQIQQRLLVKMVEVRSRGDVPVTVDKEMWIDMFRAIGLDEAAMNKWHSEFERRAPGNHHQFLLTLGASEEEALLIRERSRNT